MITRITLEERIYTQRIPRDVWYTTRKHFTKYIAENGNAICAINGEIVEPEAGNETYRKLKAKGAIVKDREVFDMNDAEIIEYIESGIDRHIEYIENYRQYAEAKEHNDKLYKLASEFRRIAESQRGLAEAHTEKGEVKMRIGDFLMVYDDTEPFWVNYPDESGSYDARYFYSYSEYVGACRGRGLPFRNTDEVENITHDGEGVLTIELKWRCEQWNLI